jgi:hypothetical protein
MRRLVFAHGPWQLLLAASALKQAATTPPGNAQDILVLLDRGFWSSDHAAKLKPGSFSRMVQDTQRGPLQDSPFPSPIGDAMSRIAPVVWPWSRIIVLDIDDYDVWNNLIDCRKPVEILRDNLNLARTDELWFDCLEGTMLDPHRVVYRVAAELYPKARIVLYEDGLDTYVPLEDHHLSLASCFERPRFAYHSLRARIRQWRRPHNLTTAQLLHRHLARVTASYLWITLMLPPPAYQRRLPWVQLQTRFIKDTVKQAAGLAAGIEPDKASSSGRAAILLGQCFSSWGHLERTAELDCYIDMTRRLKRLGYQVMWKEHPRRARDPLFPDLVRAEGVHAVPEIGPWPVELFVERWGITACAAITSTALFSLPLLFGIHPFSTAACYISTLPYPNDVMARLVAESIPHLDGAQLTPQDGRDHEAAATDLTEPPARPELDYPMNVH